MELKDWIELVKTTDLKKKQVKEAFKVAIEQNSAELAYELACLPPEETNRELAEKIVLNAKDPHFSYLFARDIPHANVKMHEKLCLKSKDLETAVDFARDIPTANVSAFEKIILDSQSAEYSYKFVEDVEGADVKYHQQNVINSRDEYYIKKFRDLDVAGIEKRTLSLALGRCAKIKKPATKEDTNEM